MLKNLSKILSLFLFALLVLACTDEPSSKKDDKPEDPEPAVPTKEGKAFLGWYKSENFDDFSQRMDWTKQLTKVSFRLYPKWADATDYTLDAENRLASVPPTATVEIPYNVNKITIKRLGGGGSLFGASSNAPNAVVTKVYLPTKNLELISGFNDLTNLSSITIPGNVKRLEGTSFLRTGLTSVTLFAGLEDIATSAFQHTSLSSVSIPSTVKFIGAQAFAGQEANPTYDLKEVLSKLTSVRVEATTPPTATSGGMFAAAPAGLSIKVPPGSVAAYKTAAGWSAYADKISGY